MHYSLNVYLMQLAEHKSALDVILNNNLHLKLKSSTCSLMFVNTLK